MTGGPVRSDVVARVTADAVSGEILDSELGSRDNEISGTHSIGRRVSRYSDNLTLGGVEGEIAITDYPRLCLARVSAWTSRVW